VEEEDDHTPLARSKFSIGGIHWQHSSSAPKQQAVNSAGYVNLGWGSTMPAVPSHPTLGQSRTER
jgi:hypothetical protein